MEKLPAFARHRDTAPAFWSRDILWILLATAQETGGRFSMMEQLCPQNSGPPAHLHMEQDETFFVLEGSVEFTIGGENISASTGDFVAVPR